ncbi:MAG: hypothetical protein OXU72_08450 [Gammaproteobacteria bacterium]|nr:hypothetical protein [Gammaproteobacteria bacterium]
MACPHVSGIAALWMEATGDSGAALRTRLNSNVRALPAPASDPVTGWCKRHRNASVGLLKSGRSSRYRRKTSQ